MPYISAKDNRREKLRNGEPALLAGELNYQIFYYVKHNLSKVVEEEDYDLYCNKIRTFVNNFLGKKPNYQRYNDMTGVLIRCEKEILRRLKLNDSTLTIIMKSYDDEIAKYEDTKIRSNGDVE